MVVLLFVCGLLRLVEDKRENFVGCRLYHHLGCTAMFLSCGGSCADLHMASYASQVRDVGEPALTCIGSTMPPSSSWSWDSASC